MEDKLLSQELWYQKQVVTQDSQMIDSNQSGGSFIKKNGQSKNQQQLSDEWDPCQTRVFDVFFNVNSRLKHPDVFSYDVNKSVRVRCKERDEKDGKLKSQNPELMLVNTGQGRRVQLSGALKGFVSKRSAKAILNFSLPLGYGAANNNLTMVHGTPPNTGSGAECSKLVSTGLKPNFLNSVNIAYNSFPTPLSAANQGDKWSPQLESAFLVALSVIMKNGTSKLKLREKNYGRNELISLYIKHQCGEIRTKKQISSHIQVWKKSILNKIAENIDANDFEKKLLDLIEHGATQSKENWLIFEFTFNHILDAEDRYDGINLEGNTSIREMEIPDSSFLNTDMTAHFASLSSEYQKESTTPLEFAQEIYSHLRAYKCVPVKAERHPYRPSWSSTAGNKTALSTAYNMHADDSQIKIIEAARKVEFQQRKLIEELFQ